LRVFVDIDLGDGQLAVIFAGELFERGRDHAAWAAPFRPEIHNDRHFGVENVSLKALIGNFDMGHENL
jgi:hypothetical protein